MTKRQRNHWGWGWQDKFPADKTRQGLGKMISAFLGFPELHPESPVPLQSIQLPSSRHAPPESLQGFCSNQPGDRIHHTYGKAYRDLVRGFHGDYGNAPDWVAYPQKESDIRALLEWASRKDIAVIPFGGGTSVVAGVEACNRDHLPAVCSLDMRAFNRVQEVDPIAQLARIQAGTLGPHLEEQLGQHGFTLRHFPQSFEFSSLGGWIATRAGGHFATVYTHIDELVAATRTLTPSGLMETEARPASGAGPCPNRLILGSEGTLGIITEAWMRLHERPRYRTRASVLFDDFSKAVRATRAIAQSRLFPSNCRLLDKNEARLHQVPTAGRHVLLLGFEAVENDRLPWMKRALALTESEGGECPKGIQHQEEGTTPTHGNASASWRAAFLDAPYLFNSLVSLGVICDTFETACTWSQFPTLHHELTQALESTMRSVCGQGFISCRFTHVYPDGPAPYYTFIAPGRRGAELEQWATIKATVSNVLRRHGATITHHHAVGRTHRPWYDRERPELFARVLRASKKELDPRGILNPGVLLDP